MSIIGNLLWIVLGGFVPALFYLLGGIVLCLTVVGIPFGIACWKMVPLALLPLGREVVPIGAARDAYGLLATQSR